MSLWTICCGVEEILHLSTIPNVYKITPSMSAVQCETLWAMMRIQGTMGMGFSPMHHFPRAYLSGMHQKRVEHLQRNNIKSISDVAKRQSFPRNTIFHRRGSSHSQNVKFYNIPQIHIWEKGYVAFNCITTYARIDMLVQNAL